jgi:uncharacterized protein YjbJ (UPF0337 family)
MSAVDKMKDIVEEVAGKTREVMGNLTGNEVMVAEGVAEQIDAEAKLAVEHAKDAKEHAKDAKDTQD